MTPRAFLALAGSGFRRWSTYRQATAAACFTNTVFGFLRAYVLLAVVAAGMGLCIPATTSLAQEAGRRVGGTASALQGGLTFGIGALATPLTGLTGAGTVTGMATIMAVFYGGSVAAAVLVSVRPGTPVPADQPS